MRRRLPSSWPPKRATQQDVVRQKQHDAFLMNTYTSVKDIEALRDVRLDQLQGQRVAAEQYVDSLHVAVERVAGTRARSSSPTTPRPDAHSMPDDLAEDLVHTLNELRTQNNALMCQDRGRDGTLKAQFQADIERYHELHASRSAPETARNHAAVSERIRWPADQRQHQCCS